MMELDVRNIQELRAAIRTANQASAEMYIVHLTGEDEDYVVSDASGDLFGPTAFPVVIGQVQINGNGRIIMRDPKARAFRLFGIEATSGHPNAQLVLKNVALCHGDSGQMGGGAIVNNGKLVLEDCAFQNNQGTHGGAIYAGDGRNPTIVIHSLFNRNLATIKGGAIFGAGTCRLHLQTSFFFGNISPNEGSSVHLDGQDGFEIQGCAIWDGITFGTLVDAKDLSFTNAARQIDSNWIEIAQREMGTYDPFD